MERKRIPSDGGSRSRKYNLLQGRIGPFPRINRSVDRPVDKAVERESNYPVHDILDRIACNAGIR